MAPPKSSTRSQQADPQNDQFNESDTPATPDPNRELVQQIAEQLATANARIAALEAERQQPANPVPKDPKIALPSKFSGKFLEFRNFMAQCALTFTMCSNIYDTD